MRKVDVHEICFYATPKLSISEQWIENIYLKFDCIWITYFINVMDGLDGSDAETCLKMEAVTLQALYLCHNLLSCFHLQV